jgi:hypothetical protein
VVADQRRKDFHALADEPFADLLKKYGQPVGLKAVLKESVAAPSKRQLRKCCMAEPIKSVRIPDAGRSKGTGEAAT